MRDSHLIAIRAGLFDSVQGSGNPGWRSYGVPVGGPFDLRAHGLANALVGNGPRVKTIEISGFGGLYEANGSLAIALAGAPMAATIERAGGGRSVLSIPQSAALHPGDRLSLKGTSRGLRTYLATRGGWIVGGGLTRRLEAGERVRAGRHRGAVRRPSPTWLEDGAIDGPIRILDGPDAPAAPIPWEDLAFRVDPESNRMGLRLSGPGLDVPSDPRRLSTPVAPGAVQLAGGRLIVLGPDGGTMGGYPHVAHVISADLSRLGQLRPGEEVRWARVSLEDARRLDREDRRRREEAIRLIRAAVGDEPESIVTPADSAAEGL